MTNFLINLFNKAPKSDNLRTTQTPDKYVNEIALLNTTNQTALNAASQLRQAQYNTVDSLGNTTIPGK